jgi:hypothetical protein
MPYEILRGLPFGHPPFFAFLTLAATLAGLRDLPPSLPISASHSRAAAGTSGFCFMVGRVSPAPSDNSAGMVHSFKPQAW